MIIVLELGVSRVLWELTVKEASQTPVWFYVS